LEFAQNETPGTLITEQLNTGKADFYYKKSREEFWKGNIKFSLDLFKLALKFRNDIDTDNFERFIVTQGARLLSFRKKFKTSLAKQARLEEEIFEAKETNENYSQVNAEKTQKIKDQNSSIEMLLNKTREFESETELLKKELKQLENEKQADKAEIKRLRNLKWYDKLFGKK
jgi:vacuolar-type H+-ATPase subunit I/STV1